MKNKLKVIIWIIVTCFAFQTSWSQSGGFETLKSLEIMDQIYEHLDLYFVD